MLQRLGLVVEGELVGTWSVAASRQEILSRLQGFTELLAHPRHLIAEAVGIDETSAGLHHVPSGEGTARSELIDGIAHRFANLRAGHALRCALTGKSGIGKSRLAAMFAHTHRHAYDRVCWIDSESEASVHASVISQRHTLGLAGQEKRAIRELAESFRESIATSPGRWLVVFDNARTPADIEQWLPNTGSAHVLMTSNNEVAWSAFSPIEVRRMTDEQAFSMLRSRLETDDPTAEITPAEVKIINRFGGWPLALQLVAAHFHSLPALTLGVETYLAQISDYVIDDPELDHDGYPRTLQAAIHMCLDRLATRAESGDIAAVDACKMLTIGSIFASHAIPDVLLYSVASSPVPSIHENRGYPIPVEEKDLPKASRAIHRIRTESLVDRSISADEKTPMPLRAQVEINEIIQTIIRNRENVATLIDSTAHHLSTYLDFYLQNERYTEAILIQPHALSVLGYSTAVLHELAAPESCATLAGNQAVFLDIQGRSAEATPWLEFEMTFLRHAPHHSHRLIAKTSNQLILNKIRLGRPRSDILPHAMDGIQALEESVQAGDLNWEGGTVVAGITQWLDIAIGRAEFAGSHEPDIQDLKNRCQRLAEIFPTDETFRKIPMGSINSLIKSDRDEEALAIIEATLDTMPTLEHHHRLALSATRLETLAYLRRFDELSANLDRFVADLDMNPLVRAGIDANLINTGNALTTALIFGKFSEAAPILDRILTVCRPMLISDYHKWCHAVLSAAAASFRNDREGVRRILAVYAAELPASIPDTVWTIGMFEYLLRWLKFWLECADSGQQARLIEGNPLGPGSVPDPSGKETRAMFMRVSKDDRARLPELGHYSACRQQDCGSSRRIIELRHPESNAPFAWIEYGIPERVQNIEAKAIGDYLDSFATIVLTTSDNDDSGTLAVFSD
ncbi:NB-ARC domain-containing protein [Nocardia sp. NPDC056064]|uniref:NB-ARC domain-containing protein n=1 Tax=Nocardia sp. NPDC056064 TaxID=3345701 RepID=UPI0035DA6367